MVLIQMADQLQNLYVTLEQRVEEKSRSVEVKNRELAALYDVATFLNSSTATEPLCGIVLDKLAALMGARDGVVRLVDSTGEKNANRRIARRFGNLPCRRGLSHSRQLPVRRGGA